MTDEEKFQKTFDKLHASLDVLTEVLKMTAKEQVVPMKKKRFTPKAAAAIAAVVLAAGSGSAAYAMDVGGIQRIVQVWIHGDQTDAIFNVENGNYTLDYKDADGNDVSQGGGGVAYENGTERPLTADSIPCSTERQRTVLTAMVQKAQKANLTTINSLIDELFGDIKTSFSNTELISLAAKVFNYSLGETIGFPFEKNTTTLGNKGSVVVPCDLESNVKQLHVFLYDDNEYAPTDTVKNNSAQIVNDTGFHQGEGY